MSEKQCSACSWCFPICCCTGDQIHIPLAILSVLMVLGAIGSISDLEASAEAWSYYGTGAEIMAWLLAILNVVAPFTYIISLFQCIEPPIRRILVFIFFIYLVIDAILIGIFAILFLVLAASIDTADCVAHYADETTTTTVDYESFCDIIATILYATAVITALVCLMHVNWAGATWYYYSNNMEGSDGGRWPTTTSGGTV